MKQLYQKKRGKGEKAKKRAAAAPAFPFSPLRLFVPNLRTFPLKIMVLLILVATLAVQGRLICPAAAAPTAEKVLEELQYLVDIWIFTGAARAGVILKSLGGGRYRAELAAEAQGLAKAISGQRRDNYATEMVFREGRLVPLVYREECRRWGKYSLKEYRFDYEKGRLELWQHQEGKGLLRKWDTALTKEPIYDPLSVFYNLRLGALRRPGEGETVRLQGIPYPRPEEIVIRMGAPAPEGRKVMVNLVNRAFDDEGVVLFILFDEKWTPSRGWTRIMKFGKVAGKILPGSKALNGSLPEMQSRLQTRARGQ